MGRWSDIRLTDAIEGCSQARLILSEWIIHQPYGSVPLT